MLRRQYLIFKMTRIKFCPKCKSENITFKFEGADTIDICKDCGHEWLRFPETDKETLKKIKGKKK